MSANSSGMRVFLAIFTSCLALVACSELGEPVSGRVDESILIGDWKLKNSPRGPSGRPKLEYDPGGSITLEKEGVCVLENFLMERTKIRKRGAPISSWTQITGGGTWKQQEWHRSGSDSQWSIEIKIDDGETAKFAIWKSDDGALKLAYRPDPEMAEPFIFGRDNP